MNETEKLLRAALFALNSIPNRGLDHPDFKDTYTLAKAITLALSRPHRAIGLLLELLANAYNEGFGEGMREHTSSKGGWPWNARKQKYSALLDRAFVGAPAVAREPVGDGVRRPVGCVGKP